MPRLPPPLPPRSRPKISVSEPRDTHLYIQSNGGPKLPERKLKYCSPPPPPPPIPPKTNHLEGSEATNLTLQNGTNEQSPLTNGHVDRMKTVSSIV